jgi:DNA topoisomerase-2
MSESYKKLSQREHVYELPDSYVGSVSSTRLPTFISSSTSTIEASNIEVVPALFKIFDEVLVNAIDQHTRQQGRRKPVTRIDITVTDREIRIANDGRGIPIKKLPEYENIYAPSLIFGELLTSSNYDKKVDKVTGGKNGFGAKLANIFSTRFCVETVSGSKKFKQVFRDNMKTIEAPKISRATSDDVEGTTITFEPDLERFGLSEMSSSFIALCRRRAMDTAAWGNGEIAVTFNDEKIQLSTFRDFAELVSDNAVVCDILNKRWEIAACCNDDEVFHQYSLVNGICTTRGGTHVNAITSQICEHVARDLSKKHKQKIKPIYVKNQLSIFVKCQIVNPSFDSQTKETLTTNPAKFGSKCVVGLRFIRALLIETELEDRVMRMVTYREGKVLKKSDGKKVNKIKGLPKLVDANKAGGRLSRKCTLILTEGDSAKTMAVSGLSVVGRDFFGVFPLRGKLMNTKDTSIKKISENAEITALKKIIGLKDRTDYSEFERADSKWPLRYGSIIVMTDQDVDGSHIKGLLMSLFHSSWKSLLQQGFVTSLITPIIKVFPRQRGGRRAAKSFYTLQAYEEWKNDIGDDEAKKYRTKYYKGLGTSTTEEAKGYFRDMRTVSYTWDGQNADDALNLAFAKDRSDDRKEWISNYDPFLCLTGDETKVSISDFVHKDLIHFSYYNVNRSIPSVLDGLKPSQRKVLWSAFKRNLTTEIKVAQLSGYVAEHAAYHHGENSLQDTIVGMAQDFVGSNNLNLLLPNGTFGTRLQGGKDAASARYIYTQLAPWTRALFPADDDDLLTHETDDGVAIEPVMYVPLIPMVLVNGAAGIATGYSTNVPMFNPLDLIKVMRDKLARKLIAPLTPWFKNFTGDVVLEKSSYTTIGRYTVIDPECVRIDELPVGAWTEKYREYLERLVNNKILRSYVDHSTETEVSILLQFVKPPSDLGTVLRLKSKKHMTNMYLIDSEQRIKKYDDPRDICDEFFEVRMNLYRRRKKHVLRRHEAALKILRNKSRFIQNAVEIEGFLSSSEEAIHSFLEKENFDRIDDSWNYLCDMKMSQMNEGNVVKLEEKIAACESIVESITKTSTSEMYRRDLDHLEQMIKRNNR